MYSIPFVGEKSSDSVDASHTTNKEKPQTITQQIGELKDGLSAIQALQKQIEPLQKQIEQKVLELQSKTLTNVEYDLNVAKKLAQAKFIQDLQRSDRIQKNVHNMMPPIIQIDPRHPKISDCILFVLQDSINSIKNNHYLIKEENIPGICDLIISLCEEWTGNIRDSAWKCMTSLRGKFNKFKHDILVLEDRPKEIICEILTVCIKIKGNHNYRDSGENKNLPLYIANELTSAGEKTVKDLLVRLCIKGCCHPQTFID